MTLLEECIVALKDDVKILEFSEGDTIFKKFENSVPITFYGRIDWDRLADITEIDNYNNILTYLDFSDKCYVLWNNQDLPVIETTINSLLNGIDDVLAVSFDTWVFIQSKNIIIEFYHGGLITLLKL